METKFLKYLVAVCLTFGLQSASAQASLQEELIPGSCSYMSKNPRCWESQTDTKAPRPIKCQSKDSCNIIKSVHQDSSGQFHCKAIDGSAFFCNMIAEQIGTQLEGVVVKVTTPYVDACHIPGGCGPSACMPSYGEASLDESCQ